MLRDNVDEWARDGHGEYNFVTNPDGVLKYWEQRVRENARYENIYTLGMRGIHDSGMPGGGTPREKAERLHTIIADQRAMLARWVNPDVTRVPQIFCPYKEVLELYRLMPDLPDDITLVWPDDNYGYIREFSDARERQRSGGAGVYYHVSYYGRPRDYLWLCSTAPGLIAEEMTKAYDYGANRVWILNVGDLKPAELDIEFFLKLAWNPHLWNGTNTYDLLEEQLARDFGIAHSLMATHSLPLLPKGGEGRGEEAHFSTNPSPRPSPRSGRERVSGTAGVHEITSILAEYYRLNFQRKPEHMPVNLTNTFSTTLNGDEAKQRLEAWQKLSARAVAAGKALPANAQDAFFELVGYPVEAAAALNEKCLALDEYYTGRNQDRAARLAEARRAQMKIERLTYIYNQQIAGGKWRDMMSDNPRHQLELKIPSSPAEGNSENDSTKRSGGRETAAFTQENTNSSSLPRAATRASGADFIERNHCLVMEAEHASAFVPGKDAHWQKIIGVGYNGEAVTIFPALTPVRDTPEGILSASPCLQYRIWIEHSGDWKFTVRALPTFSVEAGKPQRYAIAVDDEPPQIVSLPASLSETDRHWQENVLRNAALTASVHAIARPGGHTLKIWMVDPGIVLDTIAGQTGPEQNLGYTWPAETRRPPPNQ
jgi:Glycosyl hydrolase family 115/Gylcosyl hydrolase family 115 C-terminal domain